MARIPERIGYGRPWRNLFLTRRVPPRAAALSMHKRTIREIRRLIAAPPPASGIPPAAHHIHQYLHLAQTLGANPEPIPPHIAVSPSEVTAIQERFKCSSTSPKRSLLFGLNAGAEYGPAKRWPRERFISAAKALLQQTNCSWWIFGSAAEEAFASAIAREIAGSQTELNERVRCLAGQTSLRELCAGLRACDLLLTNDSGPMHLAAAVGTPVIALFGSTSPQLTGPGLPGESKHSLLQAQVPCSPCFRRECPIDFRCMNNVSVEQIIAAALSIRWRGQNEG